MTPPILRRPRPALWVSGALAAAAFGPAAGCVRAPDVAVVSSNTALEVQAAGDYPALQDELDEASLRPRPEDIPRETLAAADQEADLGVVAELYARVATDQDRLDQLLRAGCVGEAADGLLTPRPDTPCPGNLASGEVARLLGRANVHRRQVWAYLEGRSPEVSPEEVRRTWRTVHLERVVCGAPIEQPPDGWVRKECPR